MPSRTELRQLARIKLREAALDECLVAGKVSSQLLRNWLLVIQWSPELRYSPAGTHSPMQALQLLNAIRDPHEGVLTWLARRW